MISVDNCRRVTAGSENKPEQRQVKPSRSHIFLKASILFPQKGLQKSVYDKYVVEFSGMTLLLSGKIVYIRISTPAAFAFGGDK